MINLITKKTLGLNWKLKISLILSFTVLFSAFMKQGLVSPVASYAAEMVSNGTFSGNTGWTFTTATYDSTVTQDGTTGSAKLSASGRNTANSGTVVQSVSIAAGSTVSAISLYTALTTTHENTGDNVEVTLRYADLTTATILTTAELTNGSWALSSNSPALTLAQDVDQIIITMNTKTGNNAAAAADLWVDGVSITFTAPAGDTTPPTVSSTTPASGATGVTVNSSLQVVFNENIDCTTAAAGNITMAGATIGSPTCSAPTTTITYPISGQAGGTLYTYTIGSVKDVAGNTMTTTANRTYTTAAAAENPNTVSATSAAVAGAATDTQANVVMQRLTINSNTVSGSNNQVVLSTLTLDDAGNATAIATVKVYISSTSSATLPANAVLLGGKSNWDGASTVLGLVGGKVIDRTVTAGTAKYLYIVYDMAFDQSTKTVQAHVSNVGVSSPDTSAAVNLSSTLITLTDGSNVAVVTACTSCHAMPPLDASGTARNTPATAVVGSHFKHGSTCSSCHVTPATLTSADFDHRNNNIEFIGGVGYSKGASFAQTNPVDGSGLGTCSTATCHNAYGSTGIATTKWGTAATCASCHAAGGDGSPGTGSHTLHMALGGAACNQCHDGATAGTSGGTAHLDTNIDVTNGYPANVAKHTAGSGYSSCTTATCHANVYGTGTSTTPVWGVASGCSGCHTTYPITASGPATGSHAAHTGSACTQCHASGTTATAAPSTGHIDGNIDVVTSGYPTNITKHAAGSGYSTCSTASCHINVYGTGTVTTPAWGVDANCSSCHTIAIGVNGPDTGSHTAHAGSACNLCHNAGTTATTVPSTAHIDGNIDVLNGYPLNVTKHTSGTYTGTCSTASCHADPYSAATAVTPVWGSSGAGCSSCHGAEPITATGPATGGHSKHMGLTGAACIKCHNAGTTATTTPATAHGDGNIDIVLNGYPVNIVKHASGTGYSTCTASYCHSSGQSSTGGATPVYLASPNWSAVGTTCASCHMNMDSNASAYGDHVKHAQTNNISCATCHSGYTETTVAAATHVNQIIETTFSGTLATGTSYSQANQAVGNGYGNCTNSYCHSAAQSTTGGVTPASYATPVWGTTVTTCGSCHLDFDSNASATGDHVIHAQTKAIACATCHNGYTETTVAVATHVNKTIEVDFSGSTVATGTLYSGGTTAGNHAAGGGFGTCTNSYCHSTGQSTTGGATPTYASPVWNTAALNCGSCHLNFDSNASATGDHVKHAQGTANLSCATCHNGYTETTAPNATHINKTIELSFSGTNATGTTYSQGLTSAVGNNFGSCSTSKCHGSGAPVWGGALYSATVICENCHGSATSNPFYSTAATGAVPTKTTAETDTKVGAHLAHLTARAGYTNPVNCGECHTVPGTVTAAGHMDGNSTPVFSGDAVLNAASPTYATSTCSNTYCHGAKMFEGSNNGSDTSPTWTNTAYLTGTPSKTGDCAMCHGCPPNSASHGTETLAQCNSCHPHVNVDGTFTTGTNRGLHLNGIVEAAGGSCIGCHANAQTGTHGTPRAAITTEFGLAWGHKKSGRGAVTDADCIVCHLEGVFATQAPSATYHKDGNIDLRDPDGTGEVRITNISGGAFTFTRFATSYNSGDRTSTGHTANTVDNVITQKFCLKCHDAGGATNTSARAGSSPTATAPFGGGFTAINSAAEFATSNSSKHPVLGPLSRDYPTATRMAVPYKPTGTRGTSGTKTAGVVMNCFDCHNAPTTPLTTRTIVAHGNANTIRGTIGVASPTLCATCHLGYTGSGTLGHNSGTLTSGSAFGGSVGRMQSEQDTCENCHADVLSPARPARATNVHGTNVLPAGTKTNRWALGTAQSVPVAFIRNTTNMSNHQPKNVAGTAYSPQCSMTGCAGRPNSPYSLGGTY